MNRAKKLAIHSRIFFMGFYFDSAFTRSSIFFRRTSKLFFPNSEKNSERYLFADPLTFGAFASGLFLQIHGNAFRQPHFLQRLLFIPLKFSKHTNEVKPYFALDFATLFKVGSFST